MKRKDIDLLKVHSLVSSLLSSQSIAPSQTQYVGMQSPLPQRNWSIGQTSTIITEKNV